MKKLTIVALSIFISLCATACQADSTVSVASTSSSVTSSSVTSSSVPTSESVSDASSDVVNDEYQLEMISVSEDTNIYDKDPAEIIDGLYTNIPSENMPSLNTSELTSDNFETYFPGTLMKDYVVSGAISEPLMSSIAHSVAVIETKTVEDATHLAEDLQLIVNPRKWVCVEAEQTYIIQRGNIVLVSMTSADNAELIKSEFMNMSI